MSECTNPNCREEIEALQKRFDGRYATPNEHEKYLIEKPLKEEIERLKCELTEVLKDGGKVIEIFLDKDGQNKVIAKLQGEISSLKEERDHMLKNWMPGITCSSQPKQKEKINILNRIYNFLLGCKCKNAVGYGKHALCGKEFKKP